MDGLHYYCRACYADYAADRYMANKSAKQTDVPSNLYKDVKRQAILDKLEELTQLIKGIWCL